MNPKKTKNEDEKYAILDFLAQMKYEPALEYTESVLKKDPKEFYWQNYFIFGKYILQKIQNAGKRDFISLVFRK